MTHRAQKNGREFRPHAKTHQSRKISSWFSSAYIRSITVSSFTMAEYFMHESYDEITVAFPFLPTDLPVLKAYGNKQRFNILISDPDIIQRFEADTDLPPFGVFIDLDGGYGRTGFDPRDLSVLESVIERLQAIKAVNLKGFYMHAGNTYHSSSANEVREATEAALNVAGKATDAFGLPLCFGDTPSCSVTEELQPATMISPGNFVFYDLMQHQIGSCSLKDIGVALECAIGAKYHERGEILIHGGAVHLSKEYILIQGEPVYGMAMKMEDFLVSDFSRPLQPIVRLSQEHGIIRADEDFFGSLDTGETIAVLPVHSCLTAECMGEYYDPFNKIMIDHMRGSRYRRDQETAGSSI